MAKFLIEPHFRLQEWIADSKGYFRDEGLDYEFRELIRSTDGKHHDKGSIGAFDSVAKGREADVTCACHWTVNVAASKGHTKLYADAYSVAPSGIFVPANSPIRSPEQLANVPVSVGVKSGSHYATIQALEQFMPADQVKVNFDDSMLFKRLEHLVEGRSQATTLFNGPYYLAEQLGFRKILDTTFMIAAMVKETHDPADIRRYFAALRRAQRDLDLRHDLYTHFYRNEFPEAYQDRIDTRCWGPGERIVFESYTKETFEQSFGWIAEHKIFGEDGMGSGLYENSVVSLSN